jgi:hypothetical protein
LADECKASLGLLTKIVVNNAVINSERAAYRHLHRRKRALIGAAPVIPGPRSGIRNPASALKETGWIYIRANAPNWTRTSVLDSGFRSAAPE